MFLFLHCPSSTFIITEIEGSNYIFLGLPLVIILFHYAGKEPHFFQIQTWSSIISAIELIKHFVLLTVKRSFDEVSLTG